MKKRGLSVVLALVMSATICTIPSYAENGIYKEIYVSERGSDSFDGSKSSPFRTIEKAKEYVRTISGDMSGDIVVNVEDGTYFLEDTLVFRNEDSGKNGHKIIYRGSNMPLISGGVKVGAFEPTEYTGIYRAPVDGITMMHEMYVDGKLIKTATAYASNYNQFAIAKAESIYFDLPDGEHEITIKVVENAKSTNTSTRIGQIFTANWAD